MLIYFKVSNYKSIKDEVTINFNAASISEHQEMNVIEEDKLKILRAILLYGHNASGKSKLLDALVFCRWFVLKSALERQANESIDVEPFELTEKTSKKPSRFEIAFYLDKHKYRYGFEADKDRIHKEWLLESKAAKEYPLFLRIGQKIEIYSKRLPNSQDLEKRTRKNALFLSVAAQWNVQKASKINAWFDSIYTVHGMADQNYREITISLLKDKKSTDLINQFINKADLGIHSVGVVDVPVPVDEVLKNVPEEIKKSYKEKIKERIHTALYAIHNKYNEKKEIVDTVPFLLDRSESEGTKKYFNLVGLFIKAVTEGRLVVIDEFDARLHTILSKAIIKLFNSSKVALNAQLLVASHDTALLDRELLRRDQIYFVEKNQYGETKAVSLVEFKPRKETPYYKNYLEGKYGAIPIVEDLDTLILHE